jgi:cell division protein ZapA
MREIREGGKVTGAERVAVMAALNLAHDLLRERSATRAPALAPQPTSSAPEVVDDAALRRRIQSMNAALDAALAGQGG